MSKSDLPLKFSELEIVKIHDKLKVVNAFAQISSFLRERIWRFVFEKYTELVERTKWMPTMFCGFFCCQSIMFLSIYEIKTPVTQLPTPNSPEYRYTAGIYIHLY